MVNKALAAGMTEDDVREILIREYGMTWGDAQEVIDGVTGRHPYGDNRFERGGPAVVKEALAQGKTEDEIREILMRDYGMTYGDAQVVIDIETGRHPEGDIVTGDA